MGPATDGQDTALARWLLAQGAVEVGALRACLDVVRERRALEPGVDLPSVLLARGALDPETLERARSQVAAAAPGRPGGLRDVPGFRVVRELARGGMGALFEVEDLATGARRALKTIGASGLDADDALRFRREAELLARLDHPAIVRVHAAAFDAPGPRIVMDMLEGGSLQERIDRGPLPVIEALAIAAALARGLEHAHARGVLHRDLKPRNVVFDAPAPGGAPLLVDLGLARPVDRSSLTASGVILGTPAYMAPEQAAGRRADERTDVYGLGAVLFAMLTGRAPHEGGGALMVLASVLRGAPAAVRSLRPDVPVEVERLVRRAMAFDPADRFASAGGLGAALEALLRSTPARRALASRLALALALALAPGGWLLWATLQAPRPPSGIPPTVGEAPPAPPEMMSPAQGGAGSAAAVTSIEAAVARAERGTLGAALEGALGLHGPIPAEDEAALRAVATWFDAGELLELRRLLGTPGSDLARDVRALEEELPAHERARDDPLPGELRAFDVAPYDATIRRAARVDAGPAARVLRRRLQRALGRTVLARALPRVDPIRRETFELGMSLCALGTDHGYPDLLVAWSWHLQDEGLAREKLMARADLVEPYALLADAVRLVVRVPGVSLERGEEVAVASLPGAAIRGVGLAHVLRELGRLYRLEAWRLRRAGQSGRELDEALARAAAHGDAATRVEGVPAHGSELEEYVLTLLSMGRRDEARDAIARVGHRPNRDLLAAELALIEGDPARAVTILEPWLSSHDAREVRIARAHARFKLGDPAWREDLVASGAGWMRLHGIEWHDPAIAEEVVQGRVWWPGWLVVKER